MDGAEEPSVLMRSPRTLWRICGHSVLTQGIDGDLRAASAELSGWAARVWVALDEPATLEELIDRLEAEHGDVAAAVETLLASGHVQAR